MIANILNNKELPIYAKGKNSREWIYVEDHCEALLRLYLRGKTGENYNVGSGKNLRNIDLVKKILKVFKSLGIKIGKKSKIKFVKDRPGHDRRYAIDPYKIKEELGWKVENPFSKNLAYTVKWYLENIDWSEKVLKDQSLIRRGLNK